MSRLWSTIAIMTLGLAVAARLDDFHPDLQREIFSRVSDPCGWAALARSNRSWWRLARNATKITRLIDGRPPITDAELMDAVEHGAGPFLAASGLAELAAADFYDRLLASDGDKARLFRLLSPALSSVDFVVYDEDGQPVLNPVQLLRRLAEDRGLPNPIRALIQYHVSDTLTEGEFQAVKRRIVAQIFDLDHVVLAPALPALARGGIRLRAEDVLGRDREKNQFQSLSLFSLLILPPGNDESVFYHLHDLIHNQPEQLLQQLLRSPAYVRRIRANPTAFLSRFQRISSVDDDSLVLFLTQQPFIADIINVADEHDYTLLKLAASRGCIRDVIRLAAVPGVDLGRRDRSGKVAAESVPAELFGDFFLALPEMRCQLLRHEIVWKSVASFILMVVFVLIVAFINVWLAQGVILVIFLFLYRRLCSLCERAASLHAMRL